jgi:hypothetical protein
MPELLPCVVMALLNLVNNVIEDVLGIMIMPLIPAAPTAWPLVVAMVSSTLVKSVMGNPTVAQVAESSETVIALLFLLELAGHAQLKVFGRLATTLATQDCCSPPFVCHNIAQ